MLKSKRYLIAFALSSFVLIVAAAFVQDRPDDSWRRIGIRNIADQLLRQAGDSTSRVLPVVQVSENEYELRFDHAFAYDTDSLVAIAGREASSGRFPSVYAISMNDCESGEQLYAFGHPFNGDAAPCLGRKQPATCYVMSVVFPATPQGFPKLLYAGVIPIVVLLLLMARPQKSAPAVLAASDAIAIGNYRYDPASQSLLINGKKTVLTAKESRVLEIFARRQNQTIPREQLQQEVWENEGVIVGRSLDVFISRLRKKLEADPRIKIASAHGKGYKLIIESQS